MTMLGGLEMSYIVNPDFEAFEQSEKERTIRDSLVHEVDRYMTSVCMNNNTSTQLTGRTIVDKCIEYDVDVSFVLAQAQLESTFGAKGRAARTNNVFNVCAYDYNTTEDMITKGYGYDHPDDSVEPYLKLLIHNYLGEDHSVEPLLNNFVNKRDQRYASCNEYEKKLTRTYNNEKLTSIRNLYKQYMQTKSRS